MACWDGAGNKVVDFSGDYFVFLEKTEKFVAMMKRKIILVTGGQRSGKSRYAQELALKLAENPFIWLLRGCGMMNSGNG